MNNKNYIIFLVTFLVSLATSLAHAFSPPSVPPALSPYSKTAPSWQVSSAFGPRVTTGSLFHGGIDYSQQTGDNDKGVMLKAREGADIITTQTSGIKYITLRNSTTANKLDYMHIFDDQPLPITLANANVTAAGYSKIVLNSIVNDNKTGYCGEIRFYQYAKGKKHQIKKLLTMPECASRVFSEGGNTVQAQTTVVAEEDIAPLGTSGGVAAHLHLQLNDGNDNVLALMEGVNQGLITGATARYTLRLNHDSFNPDSVAAMTAGPGFAIEVTENSLVPFLDTVQVKAPVAGGTWTTTNFSFGGRIGAGKENMNVLDNLDLETGSPTPAVKPVSWGESGTARKMWFFIPYSAAAFAQLPIGDYELQINITTVYGEISSYTMPFTINDPVDHIEIIGPLSVGTGQYTDLLTANAYSANNVKIDIPPNDFLWTSSTPNLLTIPINGNPVQGLAGSTGGSVLIMATDRISGIKSPEKRIYIDPCKQATVMWQGREWQRCGTNPGDQSDLYYASEYCEALTDGGHTDWRLPTMEELRSLIVCPNGTQVIGYEDNLYSDWETCHNTLQPSFCQYGEPLPYEPYYTPTIDPSFGCSLQCYWTSTTYTNCRGFENSWIVQFFNGHVVAAGDASVNGCLVRCVR